MHAFTSNSVTVASSWPGVQVCVCLRSALFRWWAIISGAGVYLRVRVYNMQKTVFCGRRCESVDLLRDGSTS